MYVYVSDLELDLSMSLQLKCESVVGHPINEVQKYYVQ